MAKFYVVWGENGAGVFAVDYALDIFSEILPLDVSLPPNLTANKLEFCGRLAKEQRNK